jgi:hypothetical protein
MNDLHPTVLSTLVLVAIDLTESLARALDHLHQFVEMPSAITITPIAMSVVVNGLHQLETHMVGNGHILLCHELEDPLVHSHLLVLVLVEVDTQCASVPRWVGLERMTTSNRSLLNQI